MAVPKVKFLRQRRDKRRNSHWKLSLPGMTKCPKCGEMKLAHRMCKPAAITTVVRLSPLRKRKP